MRLLELFSGTGSVRKAVSDQFTEIVSIDILPKFNPTECIDILLFDYRKYPPNYFDTIWASPPCTEYSKIMTRRPRNLVLANSIVKRTLEIIDYFNPRQWFLENPATGLLKNQGLLDGRLFFDVDYCMYGFEYRKRTRIWTNKIDFSPKLCDTKCIGYSNGKHIKSFGNGKLKNLSTNQRYAIPILLIQDLLLN